jgi:hypothetical protein
MTIIALFALTFAAFAAEDPAGTWKATMDTPMGAAESTIVLKIDGNKLIGTVSGGPGPGPQQPQEIAEGKFSGNKITFSVKSDFGIQTYSGTIKGDEMKLTMSVGDGQFTLDLVAKRDKQ